MHPALPAAYLARRLPAAPSLWVAREPGPPGEARAVPRAAPAAGEPPTGCGSCSHSGASTRPAGAAVSRVSTRADVLGANPPPPARALHRMDAAAGLEYFLTGQRDGQTTALSREANMEGGYPAQGDVRPQCTVVCHPLFCQRLVGSVLV